MYSFVAEEQVQRSPDYHADSFTGCVAINIETVRDS